MYLLDLVFLRVTRGKARRLGNVTLVEHDATNAAEALARRVRQGIAVLPEPTPAPPECVRQANLVASLNLLSQLWVRPREYVIRNAGNPDEEQLDAWCSRIGAAHLAILRSLDHRDCLVADHTRVTRERVGTDIDTGFTVYGLSLPEPDAAWTWNPAPGGERDRFASTELVGGAWNLR